RSPIVLKLKDFHSSNIVKSSFLISCDPKIVVESNTSIYHGCKEEVGMKPMFTLPYKVYEMFVDTVNKFLRRVKNC
ncbi:Elongation factor 4, partial [Frankliniella fusca]